MDAFEFLGIGRDADTKQIRLAYRRKARVAHPDMGGDADSFVRVHRAYDEARSFRASTRGGRSQPSGVTHQDRGSSRSPGAEWTSPQGSRSPRYDLAEIAYRFELGRPGHTPQSFIGAIDAELYPDAGPLQLPLGAVELISYLIDTGVELPLIVSAIVREVDAARSD